jgi:hypothetical protein
MGLSYADEPGRLVGWLAAPPGASLAKAGGPFVAGVAPVERWRINQMSLLPRRTRKPGPACPQAGPFSLESFHGASFRAGPFCRSGRTGLLSSNSQAFPDNSGQIALLHISLSAVTNALASTSRQMITMTPK